MSPPRHRYAVGLGSNRRHGRHGAPERVVAAAADALAAYGEVVALSRLSASRPLGPSRRRFANAALLLDTELGPEALLRAAQAMERDFGRRAGRRWGARVLDIDLLLWSGGSYAATDLVLPHPALRVRRFVLDPLAQVAPDWRDPLTGRTARQLRARLRRAVPVDRTAPPP